MKNGTAKEILLASFLSARMKISRLASLNRKLSIDSFQLFIIYSSFSHTMSTTRSFVLTLSIFIDLPIFRFPSDDLSARDLFNLDT